MAYPHFSPVFSDSIVKLNQRAAAMPSHAPQTQTQTQAGARLPDAVPGGMHILLQQLPNDRLAMQYTHAAIQAPEADAAAARPLPARQALVPVVPDPDGQLDVPQLCDPLLQRIAECMGCTLAYATGMPDGHLTALMPVMKLHARYVPIRIAYLGDDSYQCDGRVDRQWVTCQFTAASDAQAFFIAIYFHDAARRPDFSIDDLIPGMPSLPTGAADYDDRLVAVRAAFDAASAHHAQARTVVGELLDEWKMEEHGAIGPFVGFHLARRMSTAGLDAAFVGSEIRAAIDRLRAARPGPYPFRWQDFFQELLDHRTPQDAYDGFLGYESVYKRHDGQKWDAHVVAARRMVYAHVSRIHLQSKTGDICRPVPGEIPTDLAFLHLITRQFANQWTIDDGPILLFVQYRMAQQYPGKWECTKQVSKQISSAIQARAVREGNDPGEYPHQWTHFYALLVRRHGGTGGADAAIQPYADHYVRYQGQGDWAAMTAALRNDHLRKQLADREERAAPARDPASRPRQTARKTGGGRPRKTWVRATPGRPLAPRPPAGQQRTDDPNG